MRVLAAIAFSFGASSLCAALLPRGVWLWIAAVVLAVLGGAAFLRQKHWRCGRRAALIALSAAAALAYFGVYQRVVQQPVQALCQQEAAFSGTVCSYPVESAYGAKVTLHLDGFCGAQAVYYGGSELMALVPGNRLSGTAQWNDAACIDDTALTTFTSRGVYALLYDRNDVTVETGHPDSVRWWPVRLCRAFTEQIAAIWDDARVAGFVSAELTGESGDISDEDYAVMKGAGLSHLFAVSGLHCAFLVTLLSLLVPPRRRRLHCAVTIGVLLFYMCMVGLTPSVVRACVMQIFLLTAPLFRRESDGLTSLGAALLAILLCNPFAAASVSLQLSFAATLGIVLLSGRLYAFFRGLYRGERKWAARLVSFIAASLSVTLGAMIFTVPLTAYYFNTLSLVAPLAGLLALPLAGYSFASSFVTVLAGFVWQPVARILGWIPWLLIRCVLWLARALTRWPYHAVYFSNVYLRWWLAGVYVMFLSCAAVKRWKRRKYAVAAGIAAAALVLAVAVNAGSFRHSALSVTALDVGQGESVALYSGSHALLVDCGSGNSFVNAGVCAADTLASMGYTHLDGVAVTHYHADHTNGLYTLLSRLQVDTLYMPDIDDEYGVRERLVSLAAENAAQVVFVTEETRLTLGQAEVTVFPPLGVGDPNEQCLAVLTTADTFDVLVTGDMPGRTERGLVETYAIPDIEVLLVSHHGSKYSSDEAFLSAVKPETAIISVGKNSYGHPTQEAMDRLHDAGAQVRRTDEEGNITVEWGDNDGG